MGKPTEAFGTEAVEALALWAIDVLCEPPAEIRTYATKVPASRIRQGRDILERAGIDWRGLKAGHYAETTARRTR